MFKFDAYMEAEKEEIINKVLEKDVSHYDVHRIVQSYLYFHGYLDTLTAFQRASQMT